MSPYLHLIAVFLLLPVITCAQGTHLDIKKPSREIMPLHGPVKKVTELYTYNMSDREYREVREYDRAGNLTYRKKWDTKDRQVYFATNTFNEAGCMIRQRCEDVRKKTTNDYEIVVNIPTRQMAYKCQITGDIEIATYNADGYNISNTIKHKGKKTQPQSKYKRDADNQTIMYTRYDENGRVEYVSSYRRDAEKRPLKLAVSYKQEKRKDLNEYEYLAVDEYGNWTQRLLRIQSSNDGEEKKYDKLSKRTFEYYDTTETGNGPQ